MSLAWGLILAAGKDQTLDAGPDTAFLSVGSKPVIAHVLVAFEGAPGIEGLVIVAPGDRHSTVYALAARYGYGKVRGVAAGHTNRRACLEAGLALISEDAEWVVVQDVSRPCVNADMLQAVLLAARKPGAAFMAAPIAEPVRVLGGRAATVEDTLKGKRLVISQTPQCIRMDLLRKGLAASRKAKTPPEDEMELAALAGAKPVAVESRRFNLRIRTSDDLAVAATLLM